MLLDYYYILFISHSKNNFSLKKFITDKKVLFFQLFYFYHTSLEVQPV